MARKEGWHGKLSSRHKTLIAKHSCSWESQVANSAGHSRLRWLKEALDGTRRLSIDNLLHEWFGGIIALCCSCRYWRPLLCCKVLLGSAKFASEKRQEWRECLLPSPAFSSELPTTTCFYSQSLWGKHESRKLSRLKLVQFPMQIASCWGGGGALK